MKFSILILILSVSFSTFAKVDHTKCPVNENDPIATELRMPEGPFKGRCINSNNYRSVRVLTNNEHSLFGLEKNDDVFILANFRHLNKFWVAEIPLKSIEGVVYQKMSLKKGLPLFHGQIRFIMKDDAIRLTSQEKDASKRTSLELREKSGKPQDFVVALFGVRDLEHDLETFNPSFGLAVLGKSKYAVSYTFQSLYDSSQWALDNKQPVDQYAMDLDSEKQRQILALARDLGTEKGVGEMYNILTNNCLNFTFTVLNKVVTGTDKRITRRLSETTAPIGALKKLNLIKSKKDFVTLKDEFPEGIDKIE